MRYEPEKGTEDQAMWKHRAREAALERTRTPWLAAGCNKPVEQLAE